MASAWAASKEPDPFSESSSPICATRSPKPLRPPSLKSETRQTNWRRSNLPKYQAHLAVQRALISGALEKQACEVCGAAKVDAHHDLYDEPLNVRWLCRSHHVKLHHYGEDMFPIGRLQAGSED